MTSIFLYPHRSVTQPTLGRQTVIIEGLYAYEEAVRKCQWLADHYGDKITHISTDPGAGLVMIHFRPGLHAAEIREVLTTDIPDDD